MPIKISIPVIASIVLVAAIAVLATLSLYSGAWNPSWNPFKSSTQQILDRAKVNLLNVDTGESKGFLEILITNVTTNQEIDGVLNFSGTFNARELENPRASTDFDVKFGIEGIEISFSGLMKILGDELYIKFEKLPMFLPLGDLTNLKGQWIRFKKEILEQNKSSEIFDYVQKSKQEIIKELVQDLGDIIKQRRIFKINRNLGEEKINGENTYHYLVSLNKEETKNFILDLLRRMEEYLKEEKKPEFEESLASFPRDFDSAWQKLKGIEFEVWINKKDNNFNKIKGEKTFELEGIEGVIADQVNIKISWEINFSNFNKKIEIEAPENFTDYEEILPENSSEILPENNFEQDFNFPLIP